VPYRYLDELSFADIGFQARGGSLEDCFASAWEATLEVMVRSCARLEEKVGREIALEAPALDLLLFELLQKLIYFKDAERLFLNLKSLRIDGRKGGYKLEGWAVGTRIDPARQELGLDVKAVTLHRFALKPTAKGWQATVILDV